MLYLIQLNPELIAFQTQIDIQIHFDSGGKKYSDTLLKWKQQYQDVKIPTQGVEHLSTYQKVDGLGGS